MALDFVCSDIWNFHPRSWIVIPTNLGWRANGTAVMGAGLAKQAQDRYNELDSWYGSLIRHFDGEQTIAANIDHRLVMVPTKPLNRERPYLSFRAKSTKEFVEQSIINLVQFVEGSDLFNGQDVYLPLLGCGLGGMSKGEVIPLYKHLERSHMSFLLVMPR